MIRLLRIRDLATIEALELEPDRGLNVLTGETGAGKSVLLSAAALLAGRRVGRDVVRGGAAEASVEAVFEDPCLVERAREMGLARGDDEELLASRSVSREGRGKVFVNGRLATVGVLGELLGDALEVCSQGEHHTLLTPDSQLALLDRFGGLEPQAAEVARLHADWNRCALELGERRSQAEELARREDQLPYEIEQIESAALGEGEIESIEAEHARLANLEELDRGSARALERLEGGDGVRERVAEVQSELRRLGALDSALEQSVAAAERTSLEVSELAMQIEGYRANLEADPGRFEHVEQRLEEIRRLQARYGGSEREISDYLERARAECERIGGGERRSAELEAELEERSEKLSAAARQLSETRREVAAALESQVTGELTALDLKRAAFRVLWEPGAESCAGGRTAPAGPRGVESPQFSLIANPGEEPHRLRDAASGGELARLMLALRNVLRGADRHRVLLFDEVDAGISGRAARRVGQRLRQLAEYHQVLCITHLPSIAALGETHYRVVKHLRQGRARTRAECLEGDSRVEEIARMASGGRASETAMAHARELLAGG